MSTEQQPRVLGRQINGSSGLLGLFVLDATGAVIQNIVLARYLDLAQYGLLAALLSIAMFAFVLSDLGTGLSVCRLLAEGSKDARAGPYRSLWTARVLLSLTTTAVFATAVAAWHPHLMGIGLLLLSSEFFRSVAQFACSAARGAGAILPVIVVSLTDRVGTLLGTLVAVVSGHGLSGVVVAYLLARLLSCIVAIGWLYRADLPLRPVMISRRFLAGCLGLAPLAALLVSDKIVFYSMPVILALVGSTSAAGLFQASFKVALVPISVCSALVGAYFPDFVRDASSGGTPTRAVGAYSLIMTVAAPPVALCILCPGQLLSVMFGTTFADGAPCLRQLGAFIVLNIAYQFTVHLLPAYGREGVLLQSSSAAAAVCVIAASLLASFTGATGAAGAVTLYAVVALVPNVVVLRRWCKVSQHQRKVLLDGWYALATCLGATGLLSVLSLGSGTLLISWFALSTVIVLGFVARNWGAVRDLFVAPLGRMAFEGRPSAV